VVKNIKNKTVNIVAPADGLTTPSNNILFWWNEVDGAEKYNLQIVKPDFNSVIQLMVDTNIIGTKFNAILTPGNYQWRIKAFNAGGSTVYTTRSLKVDTTSNLNYLTVRMTAPTNYTVTNSKTMSFAWDALPTATSYNLKVLAGSASGTTVIDLNTANTSYAHTFTNAGVYVVKINASNAFSNSPYSTPISFKIDQTAPAAPQLIRPFHLSIVSDTASFRWNYSTSTLNSDIAFDSLYISATPDSTFTFPLHQVKVPRPATGSRNTYSMSPLMTFPSIGMTSSYYFWKVKSVDSVGNVSPASQVFKVRLTR
ncbi:MAG: hypothetical protein O9353_02505, partial [Bacteroidia bacterium]|nr:hypothetical protein [Bacteroidia bacterium]